MPGYFLDSSALGKRYHVELGTPEVERVLHLHGARHFISRLSVVEVQSVFARKVRTGVIDTHDFELLRRRFLTDIAARLFQVVRMTSDHFMEAERLIRRHGTHRSLRTLDALQLAIALNLRDRGVLDHFVCADKSLCAVAGAEGFFVINPEQP